MDLETSVAFPGSVGEGAQAPLQAAGVYQFLASLLTGRRVVDIWPLLVDGSARLEQAGAVPLIVPATEAPPISLEDASVDAVLCLSGFAGGIGRDGPRRWLAEFCRILVPEGLCVIRLPCAASQPGLVELRGLLDESFARTETVAESPFAGVSFFVPGTEDMALGGDLQRLASSPSHQLLFCARTSDTWPLTESLFIALDGLRAELHRRDTWQRAINAERDELRETLLHLQEQIDRQDAALTAFRRHHVRALQQTSDRESSLEALALEREQLEQRALRAESALTELEVKSRRREVELASAESELARLRARQLPRSDSSSGKTATQPSSPAAPNPGSNQKSKPPA